MKINLGDLAKKFNLELIGNANHEVRGVATLKKAQNDQLSFLANSKYFSQLKTTKAGIIIVAKEESDGFQGNILIAADPYLAFAKIATLFQNNETSFSGIHETVVIASTAIIDKNVTIGPYCIIGDNTNIKKGTCLEARVTIGNNCIIGIDCRLKANVVISSDCVLGDRVMIHPGAIIGADGFGLARDKNGWIKVPQLGAVRIGDDCEIGANTTIDRGTLDDTILERDVRLDNQIQIAHNVHIGEHTVMAGCSAAAGSAKIGKNCLIGGGVGILGHLQVCDNVTLQSMALVTHSIKKPGSYSSVSPMQETREWRKSAVRIRQLDKIAKRLASLEKKLNSKSLN
ncbi:MAG: UDP-3-O-(3-hydroxymyristoyl)glucosamine N-acyltransferase [Alcanivoracaceae bacterium]|nr:UDP-3-O-(3-hydroxymyristoyl)glucosamine N-acyltransferase [Alcanivoracaceae bacterium]